MCDAQMHCDDEARNVHVEWNAAAVVQNAFAVLPSTRIVRPSSLGGYPKIPPTPHRVRRVVKCAHVCTELRSLRLDFVRA